MDYPTTLRVMQHSFPTLFPDEWSALSHLFLCLGNGYEWENGELVGDKFDSPEDEIAAWHVYHVNRCRKEIERERARLRDPLARIPVHAGRIERLEAEMALLDAPIEEQWAAENAARRRAIGWRRPGSVSFSVRNSSVWRCWRLRKDGAIAVHGGFHPTRGTLADFPADATESWRGALRQTLRYIRQGRIFIDDGRRAECIAFILSKLTE